jgi:hypothetical protein
VKGFLKILLGGFVVFMVLAILQEWELFSSAWFGKPVPARVVTSQEREGAAKAVYTYLKMSSHFYGSAGDPRFAERIPAAPALLDEARADVAYLRRNRRFQDPVLMKLELGAITPLGGGEVEVETREFWITHTLWLDDGQPAERPRSDIVTCKYRVGLETGEWQVRAWESFEAPPEEPSSASSALRPGSVSKSPERK